MLLSCCGCGYCIGVCVCVKVSAAACLCPCGSCHLISALNYNRFKCFIQIHTQSCGDNNKNRHSNSNSCINQALFVSTAFVVGCLLVSLVVFCGCFCFVFDFGFVFYFSQKTKKNAFTLLLTLACNRCSFCWYLRDSCVLVCACVFTC